MPSDVQRALNAYIRAEGEEIDVIRMCVAAARRGIVLAPLEAMVIWRWYSEAFYSAEWMTMDDHGIDQALTRFLRVFGEEAPRDRGAALDTGLTERE